MGKLNLILIIGLACSMAPYVIMNIILWRRNSKIKVAYSIASLILCLSFTGLVIGSAMLADR